MTGSRRLLVTGLVATLLVLASGVGAQAQQAGRMCFGRMATVMGTNGADTIGPLTDGDDVVVSQMGSDQIDTNGGNDKICAGAGIDNASGGDGNDMLAGSSGDDQLAGDVVATNSERLGPVIDSGNDRVFGQTGNDSLRGGPGNDLVRGGSGNDTIDKENTVLDGEDMVFGDEGDDAIDQADGEIDVIDCGDGTDLVAADVDDSVAMNCEHLV